MKKLVVLRHGNYHTIEKRDVLTPVGVDQMIGIADKIESQRHGQTVSIYTSTADRAIESGQIINQRLKGEIKPPAEFLYEGWSSETDNFALIKRVGDSFKHQLFVDADLSEIVVIVTHLDTFQRVAETIIHAMKPQHQTNMLKECKWAPEQGEARWFDLEQKTTFLI